MYDYVKEGDGPSRGGHTGRPQQIPHRFKSKVEPDIRPYIKFSVRPGNSVSGRIFNSVFGLSQISSHIDILVTTTITDTQG